MQECRAASWCKTPRVRWKKVGTVWSCFCGNIFRLDEINCFGETVKRWQFVGRLKEK